MSNVEDIAKAVERLPAAELVKFRVWFEAFDAAEFDRKIAADAEAGRLDRLADEALKDHRAGWSRELLNIMRVQRSGPHIDNCRATSRHSPTRISRF